MKKLATLLALCLSLLAAGAGSKEAAPVDGQAESANGETRSQAQDENQDDGDEDVDADENAAMPTEEVFTPSEEISEDLAVPFPVDI